MPYMTETETDVPVRQKQVTRAYRDNYDTIDWGDDEPRVGPAGNTVEDRSGDALSWLERHYIEWRNSEDPLAQGPAAHGCYVAYNDIGDDVAAKLLETYNCRKLP